MSWLEVQKVAIAAQKAAHKALAHGSDPVPADAGSGGPLARYTRAQTLDYVAQLQNCLDAGAALPNASGPGLTILEGTPRERLDEDTVKQYGELVAALVAAGGYTAKELAEAGARLAANLEAGVSLDPATAENVE